MVSFVHLWDREVSWSKEGIDPEKEQILGRPNLWGRCGIFRLERDVLVRKLHMKTMKVIGLMHALKAKLVHE